jgi:hypothetical protein
MCRQYRQEDRKFFDVSVPDRQVPVPNKHAILVGQYIHLCLHLSARGWDEQGCALQGTG